MVTVVGEEVVGRPQELIRHFSYDVVDLTFCVECEALENVNTKGSSRWFIAWFSPVHSRYASFVMPAICVFLVVYDNSAVEEATAYCPEDR